MPTEAEIEAVARYLCKQDGGNPDYQVPYIEYDSGLRVRADQPSYEPNKYPVLPYWKWRFSHIAKCALEIAEESRMALKLPLG